MAKQQFLFAIAESDSAVTGTVSLYTVENSLWTRDHGPFACVFGKNGLTLEKREGDAKSPIGLFAMGRAFTKQAHQVAWPSQVATSNDFWVDDVDHPLYNQHVDISKVEKTWKSAEHLLRTEDWLYDIMFVIEYNTMPVVAGMGSAIFLHVWRSPELGTAGCPAVAPENAERILSWLDPSAHPQIAIGTKDHVREILAKAGFEMLTDLQ